MKASDYIFAALPMLFSVFIIVLMVIFVRPLLS